MGNLKHDWLTGRQADKILRMLVIYTRIQENGWRFLVDRSTGGQVNHQCKSVNYRKQQLNCELIAAKYGESGTSLVLDSECDYIEMENQPQELAGSCNAPSCKEECVALSRGKPFCINGKCPTLWQINGEKKYCFLNNSLKWQAAKASCIWLEAHLLEIESEAEQNLIQNKASGDRWWIGGTDEE
ncbi:uncharacterized protein LOC134266430 [Saccostrea cucullata]|uniref:uncharacterized protein LOC134266430 n=1 Tax=Saccostrea cuccullata TaxID=36930 RepID=UPI002ED53DE5